MQRYRVFAVIAAIAFVIAYLVAPVLTLAGLFTSVRDADAEALPRYVDFASIRSSVKEQLTGLMMADPTMAKNPFALALAPTVINAMVDSTVTPSGLAGLIAQGRTNPADAVVDPAQMQLKNIRYDRLLRALSVRGPFEFRFAPADSPERDRVQLVFRNGGLFNWKLVDVRIPPNALANK